MYPLRERAELEDAMTNAIRLLTRADQPTRITAYPLVVVAYWSEILKRYVQIKSVGKLPAGHLYRKENDHANPIHAR